MRLLAGAHRPVAAPRGAAPPSTGGRRATGTGWGFLLIAVGTILLLAMPTRALPAVNLHVVGVIVSIVGLLWLLAHRLVHEKRRALLHLRISRVQLPRTGATFLMSP